LEVVSLPRHDEEEMMVVLLGPLTSGVLSEECFGYLLEVAKRAGWHRVEQSNATPFRLEEKMIHKSESLWK